MVSELVSAALTYHIPPRFGTITFMAHSDGEGIDIDAAAFTALIACPCLRAAFGNSVRAPM
jgi:hypothetical protein